MSKITPSNLEAETDTLSFPVAFVLLVMGAVAMGASPVFVRTAEVGPFVSAFWRVMLALPVLFVWAHIENKKTGNSINWKIPLPILLSGLFFAGDLIFWHLAILKTTIANATLMACLAPAWVLLFSKAFIGEEVSKSSYIGLAFCLLGAVFLIGSSFQLAPERVVGDLYGIVTSFFFGLYFLAIRVARRTRKSGEVTLLSTIVTTVILFIVALFSATTFFPQTLQGYSALLALGVFSHAGGQGLLAVALGSLSAAFSSLVIFVEALAGAFFGRLIFNEKLSTLQLIGGALILFGIYIARPNSTGK